MNRFLITVSTMIITLTTNAQEMWVMKSRYLEQSDTIFIYTPATYTKSEKLPVVYLLHGYSENYRQWSQTTDLQKLADHYSFIIVTPDGFTSYYINSPENESARYEDFFFYELVPKIHQSFNIDEQNIFISGLSMGGYGALRYFILHPDYFNTAGSTSGALEIDFLKFQNVSMQFWQTSRMTDDVTAIIGNPKTVDWNQHSISTLLQQQLDFKRPFIVDCGTEDILLQNSQQLKQLTDSLNIPATFIFQPGNHTTEYWNRSIDYHFLYFKQHVKK